MKSNLHHHLWIHHVHHRLHRVDLLVLLLLFFLVFLGSILFDIGSLHFGDRIAVGFGKGDSHLLVVKWKALE